MAFLPRHGRGHRISPSELPVRANIYAMKQIGVQRLISISAVGSLKEELKPLDLVIPDQIIDRTRERPSTFFGDGLVAHVGFADPFCPALRQQAVKAAEGETDVHDGGTYVVMEGPQFSTRAESEMHRSWGASVIGMTALPEAKLAREAEMCYVTLAFVTDYDVWHEAEEDVSVELVVQNLMQNVRTAQTIVRRMVSSASDTSIVRLRQGSRKRDNHKSRFDTIGDQKEARSAGGQVPGLVPFPGSFSRPPWLANRPSTSSGRTIIYAKIKLKRY